MERIMNVLTRRVFNKYLISLFLLVASFGSFASASPLGKPRLIAPKVLLPSVAGLGGVYSTYERGINVLFSNPALYPFAKKKIAITALNFSIDILAFQAISRLTSKDISTEMLKLVAEKKTLGTDLGLSGPIYFGYVDKNFGVGLFNTTRATLLLPSLSSVHVLAGEDLYITGGYGGVVYQDAVHTVSLGFNMKGFAQTYAYLTGTLFNSALNVYDKGLNGIPLLLQGGFGVDAGFAYKFAKFITVGATLKDLYTPTFTSYYKNYQDFLDNKKESGPRYEAFIPNFTFGCSINALPVDSVKHIHALTFYFDWKDFFSFVSSIRRNYFLNFAVGGELILHRILSVRFGISDLYPQAGIGLDFTHFNLDFAVYTRELSLSPWRKPLVNIELGMRFDI